MSMLAEPVDNVVWRDVMDLHANDYNPNVVLAPEMEILRRSILDLGWIQPLIISADGTIIDGFHRAHLAATDAQIRTRYQGKAPCVIVAMNRAEAMITTIRINRAKGSHSALKMHAVVRELVDVHHMDRDAIAAEIGGHRSEVDLLYQEDVFKALKVDEIEYSEAWEPEEPDEHSASI